MSGTPDAQSSHRSRPVWFGPSDAPLFGLLNAPDAQARGAVVICPPFGREYVNAYTTFVQLAARLEHLGFAVLRFDYRSTGDSFDRTDKGSGSSGFVDDVRFAVEFVRELGVAHVAIVGMRIGATFAGLRSALDPVDALVLWDPCLSGRSFLREQLALGLLIREKDVRGFREDGHVSRESAAVFEIPGFTVSPELLDEMSHLNLAGTDGVLADKVLLLTRSERVSDRKLVTRLALVSPEHRELTGQPKLLDVSTPTQVVPAEAVAAVADWLDQVMPRSCCPITVPAERDVTARVSQGDDEVGVVERGVLLGQAGLFGIETEPEGGGSGPKCILVSVSNEHRIGPGRLWVELSRRLATNGFRCVRMDLNGVGDSPARDGKSQQPIFSTSAIDDVVDAAQSVSPVDPSDVVLFGLCSSAYHVLEAASILSARGVCAINPRVRFQPPEVAAGGTMDARRRFCIPQRELVSDSQREVAFRWFVRRLPRLNRKVRRLSRKGRGHLHTLAWRARSLLGHTVVQPGERLAELAESGTDVFLIGGAREIRPFLNSGVLAVRRTQRSGRLRMEEIPMLDHSLRPSGDRDEITRLTIDHVVSHFSSIRAGARTPRRAREQSKPG
jgi:pimeloyl-ACP methyl ester carboxylesterase